MKQSVPIENVVQPTVKVSAVGNRSVCIVVVGFQQEGPSLYPHLADTLAVLREEFGEVIYLSDDDRGEGLYRVDAFVDTVLQRTGLRSRPPSVLQAAGARAAQGWGALLRGGLTGLCSALRGAWTFVANFRALRRKLRAIQHGREKLVVVAIDHTAVFTAAATLDCPLVFWSFDALCVDAPWRIPGLLIERLLAMRAEGRAAALIVQDEARRHMVERAVATSFASVVHLPVGVRDGSFERSAAKSRSMRGPLTSVRLIQNGWIAGIRWSSELIEAYQKWPERYRLALHGHLSPADPVNCVLAAAARQPDFSTEMYAAEELSRFLDRFDVGFLGYREMDENHRHLENASLQLVLYLRLGIPVVCCASQSICQFVEQQGVGVAVAHPEQIEEALERITSGYCDYARRARALFETHFDLERYTSSRLLPMLRRLAE